MTSDLPPWTETNVIGKPLPRIDGYERVSGSATFSADVLLPDMLHAAVLRCPHPHALVKTIDTRVAEAMPGVRAILTTQDPEARTLVPRPWWMPGSPPLLLFDPHCRYAGEEVAAVAAESPYQAFDAVRAVTVDYERLPFVVDAEEALEPGAPKIHVSGNQARPVEKNERGNVTRGFAEADVVLEQTYRTSCELHAQTETLGCVARWDGDHLTVWEPSQGVFDQQKDLALALGLPLSSVRVISHYMGGGFGGKAELSKHTVIAALLARKTARPVKLFLTREESFVAVGNRPPTFIRLKAGVKKDGALTALDLINTAAVGAHPERGRVAFQFTSLYLCPNVRVLETEALTNTGTARSMRAPGSPQASWALEQMMDALAEAIRMDPVELRFKNIATAEEIRDGAQHERIGLQRCLIEGARTFGWQTARERARSADPVLRGVGVAAGLWPNPGGPPATAIVKLSADGSVNLNMGACDLGTGHKTVMAMVVSEELGVPLEKIQIEDADTATTQFAQVSGGSRTVVINGPAVREAAVDVRRQLLEIAAAELNRPASELALKDGAIAPVDAPEKRLPLSALRGLQEQEVLIGIGHRGPNDPDKVRFPFGAQFAEVEVNTRTGEVKLLRLVAAHNSGRVMNRLTFNNQVFGGLAFGVGFALTERRILDRASGRMLNTNSHDYKVPTMLDVPADQNCVIVECDTEGNTVGAKGIGEPATIPTAPAIANAIYNATGIRITESPVTLMRLLGLLRQNVNRG